MGEVLGKGSFGTVRTAFDRSSGRTLAVKIIPKSRKGVEPERIVHRIREEVSLPHTVCPVIPPGILLAHSAGSRVEVVHCC